MSIFGSTALVVDSGTRGALVRPLQGLRGLAALWVAVMHFTRQNYFIPAVEAVLPQPVANIIYLGFTGVDVFFILSGFIMCMVYTADFQTITPRQCLKFWITRLGRIYPMHVLVLAAYGLIAVALISRGQVPDPVRYSGACFVESVFLVQSWGWRDAMCWNIVSWSVSVEWLAYLLFPLIILLFRRPLPPLVALGCGVLGPLAVVWLMAVVRNDPPGNPEGLAPVIRMAGEFLSGCFLYSAWRAKAALRLPWRAVSLIAGLATLGLCAANLPYAAILPLPLLVLALAHDEGCVARWLSKPWALFLGNVSYALYMVHWIIWDGFIRWRMAEGDAPFTAEQPVKAVLVILALLGGALAAATFCHYRIELPARRWFRRRAERIA